MFSNFENQIKSEIFRLGSFGRRASDGGANLHIYYPTSSTNVHTPDNMYSNTNSRECIRMGMDQIRADGQIGVEGPDESNDEIQRYDFVDVETYEKVILDFVLDTCTDEDVRNVIQSVAPMICRRQRVQMIVQRISHCLIHQPHQHRDVLDERVS